MMHHARMKEIDKLSKMIDYKKLIPKQFIKIVEEISNYYNIHPNYLFVKNKTREASDGRHILRYYLYVVDKFGCQGKVGEMTGVYRRDGTKQNADHTTVIHSIAVYKDTLSKDADIRRLMCKLVALKELNYLPKITALVYIKDNQYKVIDSEKSSIIHQSLIDEGWIFEKTIDACSFAEEALNAKSTIFNHV